MASSLRRMSLAPVSHVNLHCLQCDSQLGIFDNEWSRLTSSYVRCIHPGAHFGTEVAANRTQKVPAGTTQSMLEGCTLAEVFCTKCSGVVGQYCKAIPGPERKDMMKQYLYKLSKTYLKDGVTSEKVDPVFGYGGDAAQNFLRTGSTPRFSMPAVPRWSQTPVPREETPSYRRTSAPVTLQHYRAPTPLASPAYVVPENPDAFLFATRDRPLNMQQEAALDTSQQANEARFRGISSILETFRGTLDDIKSSINEIRSQNVAPHVENPTQVDFVASLHSMITTMKTAQSNARELEQLRTENTALKAKWDMVQSAVATAAGGIPASPATVAHTNNLGKRKRDINTSGPIPSELSNPSLPPSSFWLGDLPSKQIPTPQSSTQSDLQSQDASNGSRAGSLETVPTRPVPQASQSSRKSTTRALHAVPQGEQSGKKQRLSDPAQPTRVLSPAERFARGDGAETTERPVTRASAAQTTERPTSSQSTETSQSVEVDHESPATPAETSFEDTEQEPQPSVDQDTIAIANDGQLLGDDDEPQKDADHPDNDEIQVSIGESVEFSDDEEPRPVSSEGPTFGEQPDHGSSTAQQDHTMDDEEEEAVPAQKSTTPEVTSTHSTPARRTRSKAKAKAASTRRKTTSFTFVDKRSVAPEPQPARRILPRRLNLSQAGSFEHATPETVGAELIELEKPKGPRQYKMYKQTTTKILHDELKELGLEEWIDKNKDVPEYKTVVEGARTRKREQTRLLALASRGVTVQGANMDDIVVPPGLDEALLQAQKLAEKTNETALPEVVSAKSALAARRAAGSGAVTKGRKKSIAARKEEIRKRDELAKRAMEMED